MTKVRATECGQRRSDNGTNGLSGNDTATVRFGGALSDNPLVEGIVALKPQLRLRQALSSADQRHPTCYYGSLHISCLYMDHLQGTLEMLVLQTLVLSPLHGYGISKAICANSNQALDIEFGSLYPALKRLEVKRWVSARWEVSENNRKAKYYRLTAAGRKQLQREHSKWAEFVSAVAQIMGPVAEGGNR
jgi:PadR family transcriptional regulator, regulatory protein PadR